MKSFIPIAVVFLALMGCGNGKAQFEKVNVCDTSLNRCVQVLGNQHKEQCYETYHACMTK